MRAPLSAVLLLAIAPLGACRSSDLGTGINSVSREYAKPAPEVCKAALQGAEASDFSVLSDERDQLGGTLVATRADGREVRIIVKAFGESSSRVSVRVAPGDRELADLVHERMAGILGLGSATTGWWFGGDSLEGVYRSDLDSCLASARRAVETVAKTSIDEERHATWCQVDGRLKDSTPLRIKMELHDGKTRVTFIVGTSKSDDHKAVARRLKDEFETTCGPDVTASRDR